MTTELENIQIAQFVRGYLIASLWASNDEMGEPLDDTYSIADFSPETLRFMKQDCESFFKSNKGDIELYCAQVKTNPNEGTLLDYAGHDFWLTRNRHGCGFWDREGIEEELGRRLTAATRVYPEIHLYVDTHNDGVEKIYAE